MGLYTKALHHVNNKDFKKVHQRRCDEQKSFYLEEKKNKIVEQKELEEIKNLSSQFKSNWRKEMYSELPPQEPVKVVEERIIKLPEHLKYDWRKEINEGMTSSGVFFNNYQATGDVDLETLFAGNQESFIFNGVGTEVASGGFDSSSGNYLQFDGIALPIEGGSFSRDALFVSANTETYTHITIDAFIGNGTNGGVTPNNDLLVYWFSNNSAGLLGFIPKISSSGSFSFELPAEARNEYVNFYVQELNPPLYSERLEGQVIGNIHPSPMNESAAIMCSQILLEFDNFDIDNTILTGKLFQLWRTLQDEYTGDNWPEVPGVPAPDSGFTQSFGSFGDYVMLWNAILNSFVGDIKTINGVKYGKNPLTYGITNLNFQRRTPISVLVPLDSPEAVSFIRVGSDVKTGTPGERYKKVMQQLKASKEYTTAKFDSNFPGSNSVGIIDIQASPVGKEASYNTWSRSAEKNAQQAASTFNQSQQSTQSFDISKMEKDYGQIAGGLNPVEIKTLAGIVLKSPSGETRTNALNQLKQNIKPGSRNANTLKSMGINLGI
jgi:hypothetical protein